MAFSPRNIVGCFLKKRLTKGGSRAPQDLTDPSPGLDDENNIIIYMYGYLYTFFKLGEFVLSE